MFEFVVDANKEAALRYCYEMKFSFIGINLSCLKYINLLFKLCMYNSYYNVKMNKFKETAYILYTKKKTCEKYCFLCEVEVGTYSI